MDQIPLTRCDACEGNEVLSCRSDAEHTAFDVAVSLLVKALFHLFLCGAELHAPHIAAVVKRQLVVFHHDPSGIFALALDYQRIEACLFQVQSKVSSAAGNADTAPQRRQCRNEEVI